MRVETLVPGINRLAKGVVARVKLLRPYEGVETEDTADHEAGHALPMLLRGRALRRVSRIPNLDKGYYGVTEGEIDAVSAMGPDSLGHSGTGWDRKVAAWLVKDISTAANVAKDLIYSNWSSFRALARAIQAEGSLNGYQANEVIRKNKNPDALVFMEGPFGTRSFVTNTREVDGHTIPVELPMAA